METRDWSLVIFTVLTQAALGAFLTLQALRYLAARHGRPGPAMLMVVLAVLSAGLLAALFHLSTPLQAARAVVNFSSSWLSREIVFGSLFAALLGTLAWREHLGASPAPAGPASAAPMSTNAGIANPALETWLPRLTAAAGLTFLCCQIAIYLLPAQPAWNSFATPAAFAGTALRLGVLGVAAGLLVHGLNAETDDPARIGRTSAATLRALALAGIAALALEFVVLPLHLAALAADASPAAAASAQRLTVDYGGVLALRLGLLAAAAAGLGGVLAIIRGPAGPLGPSGHRLASALTCGAFGLVLVSELCGRFLFYAMQVRVGI